MRYLPLDDRALYLKDSYLKSFRARVLEVRDLDGRPPPSSIAVRSTRRGRQPGDRGTLGGVKVLDTQERGGAVLHVLAQALQPARSRPRSTGRRFDHMQQHQGSTCSPRIRQAGSAHVSFHLGERTCTIDLDAPPQGWTAPGGGIATRASGATCGGRARFHRRERARLPLRKEPVKGTASCWWTAWTLACGAPTRPDREVGSLAC